MGSYVESKDRAALKDKKQCIAVMIVTFIWWLVHMEKKLALALRHGNSMLHNRMYDTKENWQYCVIEGSQ